MCHISLSLRYFIPYGPISSARARNSVDKKQFNYVATVEFKYCTKRWIPAKHLLQKICRTVYRSPKHDSVKCNSTNCHSILFLEYDYDRVDIYLYLPIKSAYSSALNGRLASGERLTKALWLGEKTMCPVLTRRNNTSKYL